MTTAPDRLSSVVRRGIVYGITTLTHECALAMLRGEPITAGTEFGYAGKTRQRLAARERQHRDTQPWSDLIVGEAFVVEQGMWDEPELDARELAVIAGWRPRYNISGNWDNPGRVKPWDAVAQRHARDDAAGRPRWVPPVERAPVVFATPPWWRRALAAWPPWSAKLVVWAVAWLLLWALVQAVLTEMGVPDSGALAVPVSGGLLGWGLRRGGARFAWKRRR
ncbi:hypothetical protein [Catenuloplanes japonicus]|uniref:hypothetical protein n=1 Tax=Catenuloplanes japonicus TaxID=33876 RepID=UPI000690191E|nr:hypothetical protein [Catenuloplanes japonicus]